MNKRGKLIEYCGCTYRAISDNEALREGDIQFEVDDTHLPQHDEYDPVRFTESLREIGVQFYRGVGNE